MNIFVLWKRQWKISQVGFVCTFLELTSYLVLGWDYFVSPFAKKVKHFPPNLNFWSTKSAFISDCPILPWKVLNSSVLVGVERVKCRIHKNKTTLKRMDHQFFSKYCEWNISKFRSLSVVLPSCKTSNPQIKNFFLFRLV